MSKSLNKTVLTAMLVLGLLVGSCVDEPTIAPVKIPFSMMRFGNMLANVDNIDVYVEGELKASNLAQNEFTDFMRITSVKRRLELRNSQSGEVLFSKTIDAVSYDEITLFAAAYYSPNIDSLTMAVLTRTEGATYHVEEPPAGMAQLYVLHGAGDTPTDSTRNLDLVAEYTAAGDTVVSDTLLTPNLFDEFGAKTESIFIKFGDVDDKNKFVIKPNNYTFNFTYVDLNGDETDSVMTSIDATINEGTRNYIYISGPMTDLDIAFEETMPLPALSK